MQLVRPFDQTDIPKVASLHHRVFKTEIPPDSELYRDYFRSVFLASHSADFTSLVCETDGAITGFLGVVLRPLLWGDRRLRAAVSSQFVVEPGSHSWLAGVELLRRFLAGPQDLSITDEANDASRRLWIRLGGTQSLFSSVQWMLPLRPFRLGLIAARKWLGRWVTPLTPLAKPADFVAAHLAGLPRFLASSNLRAWKPDVPVLLQMSREFAGDFLQPAYDAGEFSRILEWASRKRGGVLHPVALNGQDGKPAGWYIYHQNARGEAELLQIGAREDTVMDVLDHLIGHSWRSGAYCVSGRMEPLLAPALAKRICLLSPYRRCVLLHTRDTALRNQIECGAGFLSRLDGEWSVRLQ